MSDWNPGHEAIKAALTLSSTLIALLIGWFFGQRLTYLWNVRQKRREIQLATSQQFYLAYGEFFATWKLWNRLERGILEFEDRRWELHKRAAAAEAIVEGILVKLSSELTLSQQEMDSLGSFRQAFQQLRQSIRQNRILAWSSAEHPEYVEFKRSPTRLSSLLGKQWRDEMPRLGVAESQLLRITSSEHERIWVGRFGGRPC